MTIQDKGHLLPPPTYSQCANNQNIVFLTFISTSLGGVFHEKTQPQHGRQIRKLAAMIMLATMMVWPVAAKGQTYQYYALHKDGKGYLRQCKGVVNNDGTFRYENAYDGNGSSIWVYSSDGYLQNEMYYLNVANGQTLYLSTTPVTQWDLVTDGNKTRMQLHGTTKVLGLNSSNAVVVETSPANLYAACTLTVTENDGKWDGPKDVEFKVQSPQVVTWLRTYYLRKITVTIDKNDAETTNEKVVDNKDSRSYCTLAYKTTADGNKGTKWDFDASAAVIYNLTSSDVAVTATYDVGPVDPIVLASHPVTERSIKLTVTPKAFTPNPDKQYLLFNTNEESYRFVKATTSLSEGDLLPMDGTKSELTEAVNGELAWEIEADGEGYFSFKNVTTGRYLYYDAADYTVSDYGAAKIGSTAPSSSDTRYKFRLFSGGGNRDPFGKCYYIIPFEKQFAVYKDNGTIEEILFSLYVNKKTTPKIGGLYKASNDVKWKLYSYEWQNRLWSNYIIVGEQNVYTSGTHTYTASTKFTRNIKDSPSNSDYCTRPGSETQAGISYTWELTGITDYMTTSDVLAAGTSTLTGTVTLPPATRTGTLKVTATITSPASLTNNKSIPITLYNLNPTFTDITSLSEITDANGIYRLTANTTYDATSNKPGVTTFSGTLDGDGHTINGLTAPLFATLSGGTVRNLTMDNVAISSGTNVGAICGEANGPSRIYNCGILATNSTVTTDDDGYTHLATNSSSIGGSDYVGGLVGLLDGEARVVNCYSYANITSGTRVGGIVGYNNVATTSSNLKTMVFGCMFYGDITGGTNKAPVYNGTIISNKDASGVSNYNYFRGEASYVQNQDINTYNCALMAETRFLERFEFFRLLLNSHRELAAWWATGSMENKAQIMKWVEEPEQVGTSTPYPILKAPGRYRSAVYVDDLQTDDVAHTGTSSSTGTTLNTLSVSIQMGSGGAVFLPPADASITIPTLTLNITDKDPEHFNFNYYKVQLPYYNDVGTKNYTGNRVVTGWKIVKITGGTPGSFTTGSEATTDATGAITGTPYNFADRNCTNKDLFSQSGRVFNQGAYYDVPEGVTAITIEPYWAKAAYLADAYADVVYNQGMGTAYNVPNVGGGEIFVNGHNYLIAGESQKVYTAVGNARNALGLSKSNKVYDYAIVLVGNAHNIGLSSGSSDHPYTIMSADFDHDNEPDFSYILRFNGRSQMHPVRVDFLNVPGLGMAQKSTGSNGSYNFGIMQPIGWFETTNTSLFRVTQLEYDRENRTAAPLILQGGVIEQWVSGQTNKVANNTTYFHVGGNVWFKEFHRGTHQDQTYQSKHPPISVTGGDYAEFYLTGLYRGDVSNYDDNAECYINGGRFGIVAGAGQEGVGVVANGTGNIVWQIDNADIAEFYGGGINAAKPAVGNITTVIKNSRVGIFCGGPKFGDMESGKTVITTATNCTFGTYFGAGYGGNSYSRQAPKNYSTNIININWNKWIRGEQDAGDKFGGYKQEYNTTYGGVSTQYNYQFLPFSDNTTNVARLFVEFVKFSLATTHNVTSKLTGCTVENNFYGGGSLGKVDGTATSTLTDCTVKGNIYGAGFSASLPTVEVDRLEGYSLEPYYYDSLGTYRTAVKGVTTTYTWEHTDANIAGAANDAARTALTINKTDHILYTNEDLGTLGTVGTANITLDGNTVVGTLVGVAPSQTLKEGTGNVYGGGEESAVSGNTEVLLRGNTHVYGSVFGGGMNGIVGGSTHVTLDE